MNQKPNSPGARSRRAPNSSSPSPIFDPQDAARLYGAYAAAAGEDLTVPVFFGLQVLEQDGVLFSAVPDRMIADLESGRSGVDIALELFQSFRQAGLHNVYLVPPIRRGGARSYNAASEFLATVERS